MSEFKFIHDTTAFNLQNAYSLAMAANLAYENEQKIKKTVEDEWKFKKFRFFEHRDGTQAFAMSNDKIIVVAFRGTEPNQIKDWLTDLDFNLVNGPLDGKVHEGFYTALSNVWQRIERTISEFRAKKSKSLWFTGHSLGAALATLAVSRFRDEDRPVDGLYTFGQPRTGDRTFARNFNFEFKPYAFRFVNNNDIVTRMPPRALKYSHVGTFRYFTESGKLVHDISWWNRFLDRMHGRIEDILEWGTDGIKDHSMERYVEHLKKAAA
jgi:triacylglycerol lipase